MKIESYPIQMIPRLTYKSQIDLTQINTPPSNYVLIRRSLKDYNNTFDDLGFLRRDSLVSKLSSTIGLSMYFLTKIHESKFFKFRIFNSASKPWSEGERVRLSDYSKCIEIITPYCLIYFKLNDIDGKKYLTKRILKKRKRKRFLKHLILIKILLTTLNYQVRQKLNISRSN